MDNFIGDEKRRQSTILKGFVDADIEKAKDSKKDLITEHKRLVKVLESPSHKDDKEEAKKQKKELEEYEKEFEKADDEGKKKMKKVMDEWKSGKLKSSSGDKVTDQKQAIAIAYSEAGLSKKK